MTTASRTKSMVISQLEGDLFTFEARLTDSAADGNFAGDDLTIHDFRIVGEVRGEELILERLEVETITHPFRECPFVLPLIQELVGTPVLQGWRRAVLEKVGGSHGCSHINTLLLGLSELANLTFFLRINKDVEYSRAALANGEWTQGVLRVAPALGSGDVCFGLRQKGEAQRIARAVVHEDEGNYGHESDS